jgi:hypothetical protein
VFIKNLKLRKSLRDLVQKILAAQQDNRHLWNELNHQLQHCREEEEEEEQDLLMSSGAHVVDGDEQEAASIHKEIVLLENILTHATCGSGMNWYNNARLHQILECLQMDGTTYDSYCMKLYNMYILLFCMLYFNDLRRRQLSFLTRS